MQTTLSRPIDFHGLGLHNGKPVNMQIRPAPADTGVVFVRTDVTTKSNEIPARIENVSATVLCTRVANEDGVSVGTIEHVLAGLTACGVHNAYIDVDQDESPALDGSALPVVQQILEVGLQKLAKPLRVIKVLKPVRVESSDGVSATLEPSRRTEMNFAIDFPEPIGAQRQSLDLSNGAIVRNLAFCRTFVLKPMIEELQKNGFGLGGNEANVIIADVENKQFICQLRERDEACRHKMLDAVGDLTLAGHPIIGKFTGLRSGHRTTISLLRKLLADETAYQMIVANEETAATLPGAGTMRHDIPNI